MERKKMRVLPIVIAVILALATAGCAQQPGSVTVTSDLTGTPTQIATVTPEPTEASPSSTPLTPTSTATPEPTQTPMPEPVTYAIEGQAIVRMKGSSKTVIYDVTEQFSADWDCWLKNLTVQPEALYFTEGGIPKDSDGDDEDTQHALIRINFDGSGRTVLHSKGVMGYLQIVPYGDRIFFSADGHDSATIGWAYRDGSGADWLDITDYAAHYDMNPWYSCEALYIKGGMLYADITLFAEVGGEDLDHTVRIGTGLFIQHVSG